MKIYTKKGDKGSTQLFGGMQVSKSSLRVAAYGAVDELNAFLGWVRVAALPQTLDDFLRHVQETCFRLGAWLATGEGRSPDVPTVTSADVEAMEKEIDRFQETLPPLNHFLVPGGGEASARLHVARGVSRRAERAVVALAEKETVDPVVLQWTNRLSDLLFVAARVANAHENVRDVLWNG